MRDRARWRCSWRTSTESLRHATAAPHRRMAVDGQHAGRCRIREPERWEIVHEPAAVPAGDGPLRSLGEESEILE